MNYTRKIMLKQSTNLQNKFTTDVLCNFWWHFRVYYWDNKLDFSSFKGNELFKFVSNSDSVSQFLSKNVIQNDEITALLGVLGLLKPIFGVITITYIDEKSKCINQLDHFKKNVKLMVKYGENVFLANGKVTFYLQYLRLYVPQLVQVNYKRHKLGLGIFSMQGFKQKNKESKSAIDRFATLNRWSNKLLGNNVRRLLQVYLYKMNAY